MLLNNTRILIVEDNAMNRAVFQIALGTNGASVIFDRWGRQAIKKIAEHKPDLIILDLMLPNGDSGYDIFNEIRSHPSYASIPIVAVSASEPSVAIPKTKAAGFSGFIAKPIDEECLPDQLAQILAGEAVWSAGTRFGNPGS